MDATLTLITQLNILSALCHTAKTAQEQLEENDKVVGPASELLNTKSDLASVTYTRTNLIHGGPTRQPAGPKGYTANVLIPPGHQRAPPEDLSPALLW